MYINIQNLIWVITGAETGMIMMTVDTRHCSKIEADKIKCLNHLHGALT